MLECYPCKTSRRKELCSSIEIWYRLRYEVAEENNLRMAGGDKTIPHRGPGAEHAVHRKAYETKDRIITSS